MNRSSVFYLCLTLLITAFGVSLCFLFVDIPIGDDSSYAKTVFELVRTGTIVYNGWAAAMLGVQLFWGAGWVKMFGASFISLHLSSAFLTVVCAFILYRIHRGARIPSVWSLFGTIAVVLAPVCIPGHVSFMSDTPAMVLLLLSWYAFTELQRLFLRAERHRESLLPIVSFVVYLLLGFGAGFAGGTVRQVLWLFPLVVCAFYLVRFWQVLMRQRNVLLLLLLFGGVTLVGAVWCFQWFEHQPYVVREHADIGIRNTLESVRAQPSRTGPLLGQLACTLLYIALSLVWYLLPVILVGLLPLLRTAWEITTRPQKAISGMVLAIVLVLTMQDHENKLLPWIGPNVGAHFMGTLVMLRVNEEGWRVLPFTVQLGISGLVWLLFSVLVFAGVCFWQVRRSRSVQKALVTTDDTSQSSGTAAEDTAAITVLGVYCAVYAIILLVKTLQPLSSWLWDRYLIPFLPLGSLIFLRWGTVGKLNVHWGISLFRTSAWASLIIATYFGIALMHDYDALLAAVDAQGRVLIASGVRRNQIAGGFEYDFWTQLQEVGYINDPRIENPPGAYHPEAPGYGFSTSYSLSKHTPVVRPEFAIVPQLHPHLGKQVVAPRPFGCWLPPFRRYIYVQAVPVPN